MNILAIGTKSDKIHNCFTGQSVMFDGVVDYLLHDGNKVKVIDISSRFKKKSALFRSIDYAIVLAKLFVYLLTLQYRLGYVTTSQSKNGFLRDYAMITLMKFFKVKVVAHQYGANYHQLLDALSDSGLKKLKKMN